MARRSNALRQRLRCPYWRCCPGALPLLLNPRARTLTASNVIPVLRVHDVERLQANCTIFNQNQLIT
jgi:hypothetical protein